MKLLLLDLRHTSPPDLLARRLAGRDTLMASIGELPSAVAAQCSTDVPVLGRIVEHDWRHLEWFAPWFEPSADRPELRLDGAIVSFPQAANFSFYTETRHAGALLYDLEALASQHTLRTVELVSDGQRGDASCQAVAAFARLRKLPFRYHHTRRSMIDDLRDGIRQWLDEPSWLSNALASARRADRVRRRRSTEISSAGTAAAAVRAAMLVYHPTGWSYLLPIRQALLDAGHDCELVSPRPRTDTPLKQQGIPFVPLPGARVPNRFVQRAMDWATSAPLARGAQHGAAIADRAQAALRVVLRRLAFHLAWCYAESAPGIGRLLAQRRYNVVLGTDSGSVAGRALFLSAETLGIPTVFLQHGSVTRRPGVAQYITRSHCLMWGESSSDNLRDSRAQPAAIVPMGSPYLEEQLFAHRDHQPATEPPIVVAFGVPGGLFTSASFTSAAQAVCQAAANFADVRFVVRPHPGDASGIWDQLVAAAGLNNLSIDRQRSTYAWLAECRLLITMQSTLGSEAAVLGKPVIALNFDQIDVGTEFLSAGAAYELHEPTELVGCLHELLHAAPGADRLGPGREAFGKRFLFHSDQSATTRFVEYLTSLTSTSSVSDTGTAAESKKSAPQDRPLRSTTVGNALD